MGYSKSIIKREVYGNKCSHIKEVKNFQIHNLIMHLRETEKQKPNPKLVKGRGKMIRAEIKLRQKI